MVLVCIQTIWLIIHIVMWFPWWPSLVHKKWWHVTACLPVHCPTPMKSNEKSMQQMLFSEKNSFRNDTSFKVKHHQMKLGARNEIHQSLPILPKKNTKNNFMVIFHMECMPWLVSFVSWSGDLDPAGRTVSLVWFSPG